MTGRLNLDTDAYIRQISHCTQIRQVQAIHDLLIKQLNAYLQKLSVTTRNSVDLNTVFPPPPLPGNRFIIPITQMQTLLEEGEQQQHCVAVYDQDILHGRYYVYRVLAPERATLGIKINRSDTGILRLKIDQLQGQQNQKVTDDTRQAVQGWFRTQQAKQGGVSHD